MSESQTSCQGFCCSRWIDQDKDNLHFLRNPPSLVHSDLQTPIHQLLAYEQFPGVSKDHYVNVLAIPLRLVSQLFTLDAFTKYIVTMYEGDVFLTNDRDGRLRKGRKVKMSELNPKTAVLRYPKPEHKAVNHELRSKVKRIMKKLVDMVDFEIADTGDSDARTMPIEGPLPYDSSRKFPHGCRSRIRISLKLVNTLIASKSRNAGEYRRGALFVATTILHELSHALGYAVDGLRFPEAYYKNSPYAERGAQMEQQVFGGQLRQLKVNFKSCGKSLTDNSGKPLCIAQRFIVLEKWPSAVTAHVYDSRKLPFGSRVKKKPKKPYAEVSLVSDEFIADLFTNNFWQSEVLKFDAGPLRSSGRAWWLSKHITTDAGSMRVMCTESGGHPTEHHRRLVDAGGRQMPSSDWDWINLFSESDWIFYG